MTDETRGIVERLRHPNGVACGVDVDSDGEPVCQWVGARVGPYAEGRDLVVLSDTDAVALADEIERLSAEVERLRGEPVGFRVRDRGGIWLHGTWDKPPLFATSDPRYTVHPVGPAVGVSDD